MTTKLRDLIAKVRACKTAAEERALIAKECALIRTSFKDSNLALSDYYRPRNLLKLLFVHLRAVNNNGKYPPVAHFGQLESIKLIAKNVFYQKRVGYLSLSVLLGDDESLMTLVTNSVSLDLQKPQGSSSLFGVEKYSEPELCAALALNCIANVSNSEMVLNLAQTVTVALKSKRIFLRNKALICVNKIISYEPDLAIDFVEIVLQDFKKNISKGENASIISNCLSIYISILGNKSINDDIFKLMKDSVLPLSIELMTKLTSRRLGEATNGVYEPFLQTQILEFISVLGKKIDIIEYVASTLLLVLAEIQTEKSIGLAVQYECVRCIHSLIGKKPTLNQREEQLDTKAKDVLVRFLTPKTKEGSKKDGSVNNQILISLRSINQLLKHSHGRYITMFSTYEEKFTGYLKNSDSSLVKASLDLIFTLLKENNCQKLVEKVVRYGVKTRSPDSHKTYICDEIIRFFKFKTNQYKLLLMKSKILFRLLYSCDKTISPTAISYFVNVTLCLDNENIQQLLQFQSMLCNEVVSCGKVKNHEKFIQSYLKLLAIKADCLSNGYNKQCLALYEQIRTDNPDLPKYETSQPTTVFSTKFVFGHLKRILQDNTLCDYARSLAIPAIVSITKDNERSELKLLLEQLILRPEVSLKTRSVEWLTSLRHDKLDDNMYQDKPNLDAYAIEVFAEEKTEAVYGRLEMDNEDEADDLLALDGFEDTTIEQPAKQQDDLLNLNLDSSVSQPEVSSLKETSNDPFADLSGVM